MPLTTEAVIPNATPDGEILVSFIDENGIPVNKLIRKGDPDLEALKEQFNDLEASRQASEQIMSDTISKAKSDYQDQIDKVITPARKVLEDLAVQAVNKPQDVIQP